MKDMLSILSEYLELDFLCLIVVSVSLGSTIKLNRRVGRATSKMIYWVEICYLTAMVMDVAGIIAAMFPNPHAHSWIIIAFEGFTYAMLCAASYFWLIYCEHEIENTKSYDYRILVPMAIPAIVGFMIGMTSCATGLVVSLDDNGVIMTGKLAWLSAGCYYFYMIAGFYCAAHDHFKSRKLLTGSPSEVAHATYAMKRDTVLMIVPAAVVLSSIGHTIGNYAVANVGVTVGLTFIYIYTVSNTSRRSRIMVNGYAEMFRWAYIIDSKNDSYRLIHKIDDAEGFGRYKVMQGRDFYSRSASLIREVVGKEDLAMVLSQMTRANIEKRLGEESSFSFVYRANMGGEEHYLRCQVFGIDTEDQRRQIIIGVVIADEEMNREKKRIKLEQNAVINTLALEYDCVFYIDTESNEAQCYHQDEEIRELLGEDKIPEKCDFSCFLDMIYSEYVIPEDREFFYEGTRKKKILSELENKKMYAVNFSVHALGRELYYQIRFCQDPACETNIIAGFHSVDEETREEMNRRDRELTTASKSEFLSRMSHDIRTPVNGVVGMLELAKKNADDPDRVRDFLAKGDAAAHHLQSLVNDVLNLSRIENGKMELSKEPMNVSAFVDSCISIIKAQLINRDLKLISNAESFNHPNVMSDSLKLRQVILNILGNAVKFTPDGGMIRFTTEEISSDENTVTYKFVIEDNGIGMDPEFIPHIWEPFAQNESGPRTNYLGSGLGMAITKEYVDMFGGVINVDSKPREGAKFTVIIPFTINDGLIVAAESDQAGINLRGRRILLVEDNELNLEIARLLLEEEGMLVVCAENGQKACEIFESSDENSFDAILMDIMMPVMDGHDATKKIRSMDRADAMLPIIAMTANAFEEDKSKAFEAGMDAHISKPIDTAMMLKTLGKYIRQKATTQ